MNECIVELKPRPRDKVRVTLSGGRFFTIPLELTHTLSIGLELSPDEVARLDSIDQYLRGREKAMRMLALRSRTRAEISRKLKEMAIAPPVMERIEHELEELGLIDDRRFAEEYVRTKSETRGAGPHRLRSDLGKLGVGREEIDGVLAADFAGDQQEKRARDLVARKIGGGPIDRKVVSRVAGMLRRKGYDFEIVNRISYELLERSGDESPLDDFHT